MARQSALAVGLLLMLAFSGCATSAPRPATSADRDSNVLIATVRLTYTRPSNYGPLGRPQGFEVIENFHNSNQTTQYEGEWNEGDQVLSATVQFSVGSDNLLYVIDDAVPAFVSKHIDANRGRLHETTCSQAVSAMEACYELEVLNGGA